VDGAVGARAIPTGQFRFVDERREVKAQGDLEQVARRFTGPEAAAILLRLRLFGRAPQEVIASIGALRERMTTTLRHLDLRSDELRGELTVEDIDREYPAGSFPHSLLSSLAREGDLEGLDIAHELLQELRS
jgi:hypothetical protein